MDSTDRLRSDLISQIPIEQLFQKYIVDGPSFLFENIINNKDREYILRHDISSALGLSINDIVIVGSAKLGFSVKNLNFLSFDERYKETREIRDKSDIDIAIVSRFLFEQETQRIYDMSRHFSREWIREHWTYNRYYPSRDRLKKISTRSIFNAYTMNIARGWLRQDYSPNTYIDTLPWKTISDNWYRSLGRKVSIAVYSDWKYLKNYQMDHLDLLRNSARTGVLNGK